MMQHVIDAVHCPDCDTEIGQVAFDEVNPGQMIEIAPLACDQAVDDADSMAATKQLFRKMRTDETGAAGDEIGGHRWVVMQYGGPTLRSGEKDRSEP